MSRDYKADRRKAEEAASKVEAAWKHALEEQRRILYKKFGTVMSEFKDEIETVMEWFVHKTKDEKLFGKYETQDEWTKAVFDGMTAGNVRRRLRPRPSKETETLPLPEIPEGDSKADEPTIEPPTNDQIISEIIEFIDSKTRDLDSNSQGIVFRAMSMKLEDRMNTHTPMRFTANQMEINVEVLT